MLIKVRGGKKIVEVRNIHDLEDILYDMHWDAKLLVQRNAGGESILSHERS